MTDGFEFDGDVCLDLITGFTEVMTNVEPTYNVRMETHDERYPIQRTQREAS